MKVSLFYNTEAGSGISADEVTTHLRRAGHQVIATVPRGASSSDILNRHVDLVVAAGGDGTIAAAAKALAGSDTPLGILPLGTANNIAKSLGINDALPELIESWIHATAEPFDLGSVSAGQGDVLFVEGIGAGLVPSGIAAAIAAGEDESALPEARVIDAIGHFRNALTRLKPQRFFLNVDGEDRSGDFLMVEILNIRSVGPNIVLSPGIDSSDGRLSVVTAGEEHRGVLLSYFDERLAGRSAELSLPEVGAAVVKIAGPPTFHLDDKVEGAAAGGLEVQIRPAAVRVLTSAAV